MVGDGCTGRGCDDGSSIWKVARVIGSMFRRSIIGHGIRSMNATTKEERVVGLSFFHAQKVLSREKKLGPKRSGKTGNGRKATGGEGLLEKEASPGQTNGKGGWRMASGQRVKCECPMSCPMLQAPTDSVSSSVSSDSHDSLSLVACII